MKQIHWVLCVLLGTTSLAGAALPATPSKAEVSIRAALADITRAYEARDPDRAMASYAADVYVFDLPPPLQQTGKEGNLRTTRLVMDASVGHMTFDYDDVRVVIIDSVYAYSTSIVRLAWKMKDGSAVDILDRTTDVWKKMHGKWLIVHEHNSVPVDLASGKAILRASPGGDSVPFSEK